MASGKPGATQGRDWLAGFRRRATAHRLLRLGLPAWRHLRRARLGAAESATARPRPCRARTSPTDRPSPAPCRQQAQPSSSARRCRCRASRSFCVDRAQSEQQLRLLRRAARRRRTAPPRRACTWTRSPAAAREADLRGCGKQPDVLPADALHHALRQPALQQLDQRIDPAGAVRADRRPLPARPRSSMLTLTRYSDEPLTIAVTSRGAICRSSTEPLRT